LFVSLAGQSIFFQLTNGLSAFLKSSNFQLHPFLNYSGNFLQPSLVSGPPYLFPQLSLGVYGYMGAPFLGSLSVLVHPLKIPNPPPGI